MKKILLIPVLLIILISVQEMTFAQPGEVPRMTKQALRAVMGQPNVVIIDVRLGRDWTESDSKIKGAVREDPQSIPAWAGKYSKDKTLVFYCA